MTIQCHRSRKRAFRAGVSLIAVVALSGCSKPDAVGSLSVRPAGLEEPTHAEDDMVREARFGVSEGTVIAQVRPLPKKDNEPYESQRGSEEVVVVASVAKPVDGRLVLLGGTLVRELPVNSLTLVENGMGQYELRVQAKDAIRVVDVTVTGQPVEDFDELRCEVSSRLEKQRVTPVRLYESAP